MTIVGVMLLLACGLAWPAAREPQQASGANAAKEVSLFAPTGLRASIEKVTSDFDAKSGYKINATIANSGLIKKRVMDGEAFDLAVLLMPLDDAFATGNLDKNSLKSLATVAVGVAVKKGAPKPDISTPEAFKKSLLAAKSIGYPHGTPGAYSAIMVDDALAKLGITEQIMPKVKQGGAAALLKGDVDIALYFYNELLDPGIEIVGPIPAALTKPASIVGIISAHPKNPGARKSCSIICSRPLPGRLTKPTA
jgi:molybdate transport system substrate-binding protein